jgi:hypothetical protein
MQGSKRHERAGRPYRRIDWIRCPTATQALKEYGHADHHLPRLDKIPYGHVGFEKAQARRPPLPPHRLDKMPHGHADRHLTAPTGQDALRLRRLRKATATQTATLHRLGKMPHGHADRHLTAPARQDALRLREL